MSRTFKYEDGRIVRNGVTVILAGWATTEVEEILTEVRDKELGRWRSSINRNFVGYEQPNNQVMILDELTGKTYWLTYKQALNESGVIHTIASEYFQAQHSKRPGKDARVGDIWVVTWDKRTTVCKVEESEGSTSGLVFSDIYGTREEPGTLAPIITKAEMIWRANVIS